MTIHVAFPPGASGNFVAGLLDQLLKGSYADQDISYSGSVFTQSANVTWTHDIASLPAYHSEHPDKRVLVIVPTTENEQLTATFLCVLKNILDPNVKVPNPKQIKWVQDYWHNECKKTLCEMLSINDLTLDQEFHYKASLQYLSTRRMLQYYGMLGIFESEWTPTNGPSVIISNRPYNIEQYLNADFVVLPFTFLTANNVFLLVAAITSILSRTLTEREHAYIITQFELYHNKQPASILETPKEYYLTLKDQSIKEINL